MVEQAAMDFKMQREALSPQESSSSTSDAEAAEHRHQQDLAVDESDEGSEVLQMRDVEVERLQTNVNILTEQLESAVHTECEALTQIEEVDSMKSRLEHRERKIEQERQLLNGQFESLTEEVNVRTEELLNTRRDNTFRCIQLETELTQKALEVIVPDGMLKTLSDRNNKFQANQLVIRAVEYIGQLQTKHKETGSTQAEMLEENNSIVMLEKGSEVSKEFIDSCKQDQLNKNIEDVVTRENESYKKEVEDLSLQVRHLLQEVEMARAGSSSTSTNVDSSNNAADLERLVTFTNILELQKNNKISLAVVRPLTKQQEESFDSAAIPNMKIAIEHLRQSQSSELLEERDLQNKMMVTLNNQRDMYKKLYTQADEAAEEDPSQLESSFNTRSSSGDNDKTQKDNESHTDDHIQELMTQIDGLKQKIDHLKNDNDKYRKEKSANEHAENKDLVNLNSKLEHVKEIYKVARSNIEKYKKQIKALVKCKKNYRETIIKHKEVITYLKKKTMRSQAKLSCTKVILGNLQTENALLRNERERMKRESLQQNMIQTNFELIRATLERTHAESKSRFESRLDEANRECANLRRRLQEEQDRFRQLSEHVEKETQQQLGDAKSERDTLIALIVQNQNYKKENENLKQANVNRENKFKELLELLKCAKERIVSLTEQVNTYNSQLANQEGSRPASDSFEKCTTSSSSSDPTNPSAVMVPPEQVYTRDCCHSDRVPATSSARPAMLGQQRQVAIPSPQSTQDAESGNVNMQFQAVPRQQAVTLVPTVESPSSSPTRKQGASSSSTYTVTSTQAGLKRQRDSDSNMDTTDDETKIQQRSKRSRVQQTGTVCSSGLEVEFQTPTSGQKHVVYDAIVIESDDSDSVDVTPDDDDNVIGAITERMEQDNYAHSGTSDELEVIEDPNEVLNQSERSMQEGSFREECSESMRTEADSDSNMDTTDDETKIQQRSKRSRVQQTGTVCSSGLEVEFQTPTSGQKDVVYDAIV